MHFSSQHTSAKLATLGLLTALTAPMVAVASALDSFDGWLQEPEQYLAPERPVSPALHVTSWDARLGVPDLATVLRGPGGMPEVPKSLRAQPSSAARWQLEPLLPAYRLGARALETLAEAAVIEQGQGVHLVRFRQSHLGLPVFRQELKALLDPQGHLVALGGNLHPQALPAWTEQGEPIGPGSVKGSAFVLGPQQVAQEVLYDRLGVDVPLSAFLSPDGDDVDAAGYSRLEVLPDPALAAQTEQVLRPLRMRPGYFPLAQRLVPAWYLEVTTGDPAKSDSSLYAYIVSAETGALLYRENLVADVAFSYRVYADASGDKRPWAGPMADFAPHPTGFPDGSRPGYVSPVLVSMDGFNTTSTGTPDPWLASDATYTFGNNVEAYADHVLPDGYTPLQDLRATTTTRRTFDRTYDVTRSPTASSDQIMAAVTDLFYTTNWMHDYWYDSGFTEVAGNAQKSNYGRGGVEGDPLHAEGQDQANNTQVRNNANMSTPADGESPRMQMYLWTGASYAYVDVTALATTFDASYAAFGPATFTTTGNLVLVNDGSGVTSDACETIRTSLKGKIALVDRGTCDFEKKAQNVQSAQAIGMIVVNNQEGAMVTMGDSDTTQASITIGCVGLSLADGTALKNLLTTQTVPVTLRRVADIERDGTIDNSVVMHEWGHYLHKRLIPSCTTTQCRSMGEGWADFVALQQVHEDGDSLTGTYAMALYAMASSSFADVGYYGLRRAPYSIDFTKNALTFRHVQTGEPLPLETGMYDFGDNAEVHNAGEIWASMLWEVYTSFLGQTQGSSPRYSYEDARRRMSDYIVAGMLLTPPNPTYTQQRDGLLAAIYASDKADFLLAAEAFARRGAGTCAVSPPPEDVEQHGVVESFTLNPNLSLQDAKLVEGPSCDQDGTLDAWEAGVLRLTLANAGPLPLASGRVSLESSLPGVVFPQGPTLDVPEIAPYSMVEVEVPVALETELTEVTALDFDLLVEDPQLCAPLTQMLGYRVNADAIPQVSTTETFEAETLSWSHFEAPGSGRAWIWEEADPLDHHMQGQDLAALTDSSLISPPIQVSSGEPFVLSFRHKYSFETGPATEGGPTEYWDGGVIELSADDGQNWTDVSALTSPGYGNPIYVGAGNPLSGQAAYTSKNPSWPDWDTVELEFGTALSNQVVRFRFRVGCDEAAGAAGWSLDDVTLQGALGTPFTQVVTDQTAVPEYAVDADSDGFGDPTASVHACVLGEDMTVDRSDCDDTNAGISPDAPEVCDGLDNDCNGKVDEAAADSILFYQDSDGDGYGSEDIWEPGCVAPEGYVAVAGDCDDTLASTSPEAEESCDGADNNCDNEIDNDPADGAYYFYDQDGDGYGSITTGTLYCEQPPGTTTVVGDCNDGDASTYYGAPEPADGVDHNCDGTPTYPDPTPTATLAPETPTPAQDTPTQRPGDTPTQRPEDTPTQRPEDTPTAAPETAAPATPTPPSDASPVPSVTPTMAPLDEAGGCACTNTPSEAPASRLPVGAGLFLLTLLGLRRRRA